MAPLCKAQVGLATVCLALTVAQGQAQAAYMGFTTRSVCGVAGLPYAQGGDGYFFMGDDCGAEIFAHSGEFIHYSQPVERTVDATTITTRIRAFGGSGGIGSGDARVCAQSKTFALNGVVNGVSAQVCTAGATPISQDIITPNIVLPVSGAANTLVSVNGDLITPGDEVARVLRVGWTFTVRSATSP